MSFFVEIKFIISSVLMIMGIYWACKRWNDRRWMLILTALFFAVQQFTEGMIWVGLQSGKSSFWELMVQLLYRGFVGFFWPIWIPLALGVAERVRARKWGFFILFLYGMGVSLFFLADFLANKDTVSSVMVVHHTLSYGNSPLFAKLLYATAVIIPFFLSSIRYIWLLGLFGVLAFILLLFLYPYALGSFWCFLGVGISAGILLAVQLPYEPISKKGGNE